MAENYKRFYEIQALSSQREVEKFISTNRETMTNYDWLLITKCDGFNLSIAEHYPEHVDWQYLCTFHKLSVKFMEKHFEYLDIYSTSAFQILTYHFVDTYKESLSMDKVIKNESVRTMKEYGKINEIYKSMAKQEKYVKLWESYRKESMFTISEKKVATPAKKQKDKYDGPKYKKKDIENLKKAELQAILDEMKVGYYYKNTVPELITKILNKQKRKGYNMDDLDGIKKDVLHDILEERGVKIYYHDTVDELKQKVIDSNR